MIRLLQLVPWQVVMDVRRNWNHYYNAGSQVGGVLDCCPVLSMKVSSSHQQHWYYPENYQRTWNMYCFRSVSVSLQTNCTFYRQSMWDTKFILENIFHGSSTPKLHHFDDHLVTLTLSSFLFFGDGVPATEWKPVTFTLSLVGISSTNTVFASTWLLLDPHEYGLKLATFGLTNALQIEPCGELILLHHKFVLMSHTDLFRHELTEFG